MSPTLTTLGTAHPENTWKFSKYFANIHTRADSVTPTPLGGAMPCFYDPHQHGPNNVTCLCALYPSGSSAYNNLTFGLSPPAIGNFYCAEYDNSTGRCAVNGDSLGVTALLGEEKLAWANAAVNSMSAANKTTSKAHCRAELEVRES